MGAINSLQLLMLPGVGDSEALQSFGIDVVHESPAVGQHLQDHLGIDLILKTRVKKLNDTLYPWWGELLAGVQYLTTLSGALSLSLNQRWRLRAQPTRAQTAELTAVLLAAELHPCTGEDSATDEPRPLLRLYARYQ